MIKICCTLFAFLSLSIVTIAQSTDAAAVKKAFDNYKSAILNDKGEDAVTYVDSRTLKYYDHILEAAKHVDSSKLNSLPLIDKITILTFRHRASKEEITSMDGKGLFIYAIKNGMVGKNSVANNTIGEVTIDKDFAKGQLVVRGNAVPMYFHFYKEQANWKLDLTSLFPIANMTFKKMIEDSGEEENEFLLNLLEMMTGTKPGPEIWEAMK
ncbi:hypothetical protein [Flavihumibacter solisilvae]|uniref:DUF3828 domain-containing protein n=1 Tax=Flavihumibacter solisilvae TaxID=1349421 RepID=A0A0C1IH85_9BACT|nr:hypothetical protein [Flavihumibacter solisilvae]KIC93530.1 hypothetical protein OI18_17425 [Flavihumibacter solisilvae]